MGHVWVSVCRKLLWCARRMFTCLVIVMCLLGRSWFVSLNSSIFWCLLLLAVIFRCDFSIFGLSSYFVWRLNCCCNLSAIVMASFRGYEWGFIGFFARFMGFPWAYALILFHSSWGVLIDNLYARRRVAHG